MWIGDEICSKNVFISGQANWSTEGISLCEKNPESDPHLPGMEEFHKYFDIVFVDSSGYLNMAAFVSSETFNRVSCHPFWVKINFLSKKKSSIALDC